MDNFKYKKLVLFILPSLVVLGVYFLFSEKNESTKIYERNTTLTAAIKNEIQNKDMMQDSDNDGLMDWEEILWKTDPKNPDTDLDGTLDGEEIKNQRNPVVKGPDDALLDTVFGNSEADGMQSTETLTESLGQQMLHDFFIKKGNSANDELLNQDKNEIAQSIFDSLENFSSPQENIYSINDIKSVSPSNTENIEKYGNELGLIFKKHFDHLQEGELAILKNALVEQDREEINKLGPIALAYENSTKEALDISVPKTLILNHIAILNSFDQIAKEIKRMEKAFIDPALTLIAVRQYQENSEKAYSALKKVNTTFANNNIVYKDKDPGKLFEFYI